MWRGGNNNAGRTGSLSANGGGENGVIPPVMASKILFNGMPPLPTAIFWRGGGDFWRKAGEEEETTKEKQWRRRKG